MSRPVSAFGAKFVLSLCAIPAMLAFSACASWKGTVPQSLSAYSAQTHLERAAQVHRIYVANANGNSITTYKVDGSQTSPTITSGINIPFGVAVDTNGKIYVANAGNNTITTYNPDGSQASPTIAVKEKTRDFGVTDVAVGKGGKIYVLNSTDGQGGDVTTYDANGEPEGEFSVTTANTPEFLAVDANEKVYVTIYFINNNGPGRVFSFSPNGKRTTPTIVASWPWGIAIGPRGKIFVAAGPGIVAFTPDGRRTSPRIDDHDQFGNGLAFGITVDTRGYIYAANCASTPCGPITTYKPDGMQTSPTITQGLSNPVDVAVH